MVPLSVSKVATFISSITFDWSKTKKVKRYKA